MNPVQATCPAALDMFRIPDMFMDNSCTAAETMFAIFLCKGSNLQVRPEVSCGNENPKCNGCKTVSDTVSMRVRSLHRRIFQEAREGGFRSFLKYFLIFKSLFSGEKYMRKKYMKNLLSD